MMELHTPCVVRLNDFQVIAPRKIQLLKSSPGTILDGNELEFPPVLVKELEELVQRDGACPVLTGLALLIGAAACSS